MQKLILLSLAVYVSIICVLNACGFWTTPRGDAARVEPFDGERATIIGTVVDFPKVTARNKLQCTIKTLFIDDKALHTRLRIDVYNQQTIPVHFGDRIRVSGTLQKLDIKNVYEKSRIYQGTFFILRDFCLNSYAVLGIGSQWRHMIDTVREAIIRQFMRVHHNDAGRFLPSLVLGESKLLEKEEVDALRTNGLTHIVAVSGMNIALVVNMMLIVCNRRKNAVFFILAIIVSWFYAALTGFSPSCVRATLMANVVLGASMTQRVYAPLHALLVAALLMLIANPRTLFSLGFQFSFLATFGIIYYLAWINKQMRSVPQFLRDVIAVTIAAQAAVVPVIIFYFKQLSLVSFLVNIVAVPLAGFIMTGGLIAFGISFLSTKLAMLVGTLNGWMTTVLFVGAKKIAAYPYAMITTSEVSLFALASYYFCFFTVPHLSTIKHNSRYRMMYLTAVLAFITGYITIFH